MQNAGIVGAGLIGRAWALVFARSGWTVVATDASAEVRSELPRLLAEDCAILEGHGLGGPAEEVLARISVAESPAEAVQNADFVQESGPENADVKREIFADLDRHAPGSAILASSTSAITASRFTESLPGRARCLVGHPVNPPHVVPLVEVSGAEWTSPETIERTMGVYAAIGQVPVLIKREIEGFALNRLQGALLAEAFRLVRDGIISPEDADKTIKHGLGLRWSFMGPFETIDLNAPGGIADYCKRYTAFYKRLADDPPTSAVYAPDAIADILGQWPGASGDRTERMRHRDKRLAALRTHNMRQDSNS